jgi:hypothetical protein
MTQFSASGQIISGFLLISPTFFQPPSPLWHNLFSEVLVNSEALQYMPLFRLIFNPVKIFPPDLLATLAHCFSLFGSLL